MSQMQEQNLVHLVEETMRTLHGKGIALEDLAPLVKLHEAVAALNNNQSDVIALPPDLEKAQQPTESSGHFVRNARLGEMKASEELLARACAIIDVMIQSGKDAEQAAQIITRQLLALGVEVPENGNDVRAWKRLLSFRNTLIHYVNEGPVRDAYSEFKEQLSGIEPTQRMKQAVDGQLWNRRQSAAGKQKCA